MNQTELKADCQLDPNELDVACLEQADLYAKWAVRAAEARAAEDTAKLERDIVEANLASKVRADPQDYGIDRASEAAITSHIKTLPDYKHAHTVYVNASKEAALALAAEKAMHQRKAMVEELVRLHGAQYFAGPDVPRNLTDLWEERRRSKSRETNAKQQQHIRRRVQAE